MNFKYKVGDVLKTGSAKIEIIELFVDDDGGPAYVCVSPYTKGEGWLVSEKWLLTAKRIRSKKQASLNSEEE